MPKVDVLLSERAGGKMNCAELALLRQTAKRAEDAADADLLHE